MKKEQNAGAGPRAASAGERRSALRELIEISRAVGSDPDLVQGGGGNTSVKTRDGRSILVKASGTALADMDEERGWAELDLGAVRAVLSVRGLSRLPPAMREAKVLQLLSRSVVRPEGARPSVESNLHALLDRVVIHTHPVGLNAFLSSRRSRDRYLDVIGRRRGETLYVPYTDPGYTLAARMELEIGEYVGLHGRPPSVVLLENHGLFVAAPEVEECLELSHELTERGRRSIGGRRVNPLIFPAVAGAGRRDSGSRRTVQIRGALLQGGTEPVLVRRDETPLAREFLRGRKAILAARQGAFTPDQIVYCRTHPLVLPEAPASARGPRRAQLDRLAVESYRRKHGHDPRVVLSPGDGVFYAAPDLGQLRTVAEVYRAAMATILGSARWGGPRFLTASQARFIEGWEVEAFRARLATGAGRPLAGRIAVVTGAAGAGGAEAARRLLSAGATVAILDVDPRKVSTLARRLGPSCLALSFGGGKGTRLGKPSVEHAFRELEASVGGADFLLDTAASGGLPRCKAPGPVREDSLAESLWRRFIFVREAVKLFLGQGAGGKIGLALGGAASGKGSLAQAAADTIEVLARSWEKELKPAGIRVEVYPDCAAAAEALAGKGR